MNEGAKETRSGEPLEMRARLGQATTNTLDNADREPVPDESVQRNPVRHDVPARLLPGEVERVENLCFDERQLVAVPRPAEGSASVVVAVTFQAAPGDRLGLLYPCQ